MLSIVMPARNAEKYLKPCLDSIIAQTYADWELIFVDDGSTDKTAEIVKGYNDSRIKYYQVDKHIGVAHARNFGCNLTLSNIIVCADSDDVYDKNRLLTTNECFRLNNSVDICYGNIEVINLMNNDCFVRPFQVFDPEVLKEVNYIANMTTAFKKDLFDRVGGYDENLITSEDYDLWLRFLSEGAVFYGYDEVFAHVNRYPSSTSANQDRQKKYIQAVKLKNGLNAVANLELVKNKCTKEIVEYFTNPGGIKLWFE